jgi:hypothetical protein
LRLIVNRALVLVGCLAAAGAVAAYTKQSADSSDHSEVFTVHVPAPSRAPAPSPAPVTKPSTDLPVDRVSLIRELQRELKRVGCYGGDVNGMWTTSSRLAMKSFTDKVNASLPIDNPDDVLLSLVRGHKDTACAAACPPGQALNDKGRCLEVAKGPADTAPLPTQTEPVEKSNSASSSAAPAAIAAAALAGSAVLATASPNPSAAERVSPSPSAPESKGRIAAAPFDHDPPGSRSERPPRASSATPPERVYTRRTRKYSGGSPPPRFVRNVLRAFGFR